MTIDRLSYDGGRGVGRHNGLVVFVPKTAPNETVAVRIFALKKNYAEAELLSVIQPSPHRREPPCSVVQECGGCPWQHISYGEQLRQKEALVAHHLKEVLPAHVNAPHVTPSPHEFRYRHRVQIHAHCTEGSRVQFGFFKKGTHHLIPIQDCLIAEQKIFDDLGSELFSQRTVWLRPEKPTKIEVALEPNGRRVIRPLHMQSAEFTQVNREQNENLISAVLEEIESLQHRKSSFKRIYDLYCGSGNLTFPVAQKYKMSLITGVEAHAPAIALAKQKQRGLDAPIEFVSADVKRFLSHISHHDSTLMILDPPRSGLGHHITSEILRLQPEAIIYVSCSLPTLARDLKALTTSCSVERPYHIVNVRAFDMFPQTEYVECIVTLARPSSSHPPPRS